MPHESKKMDDASVKSVAPGPSEEAGGKAAKEGAVGLRTMFVKSAQTARIFFLTDLPSLTA